ncbi:MAG TPA: hypothetical protein VLR27_01450 [Acidimicrobiales bacterium]|nr:hypothetical protein [Acidimicrobiales bacterium]
MQKRAIAAFVALALVITACGDDDDEVTEGDTSAETDDTTAETEDTAETDDTTASGEGEQAAGDGEFCSAYQELLAGDPTPDAIREVAGIAPDGAVEPLETLAAGFEDDPEGFFDTEEFGAAFSEVGSVANKECADEVIAVTAIDYGYEGIDAELSVGVYGVDFSNEGDEFHEMIVLRKGDDTTESFEDILALDEEAAMALVQEIGATFAPPGGESGGLFDMSEPGEYAAICFIPVGSTPDAEAESEGPPHFTQGMIAEFTVS